MRFAILAAALGFELAVAPCLHAEPSIWERARDPASARNYAALLRVENMLTGARSDPTDPVVLRDFSLGALLMLELPHAQPSDPRLAYLWASALVSSSAGRDRDAQRLLESALARAPDSPLAAEGLSELALIFARLADGVRERAACVAALERTWEPDARASLYLNLADADMSLGELARSAAEYRRAIAGAGSLEIRALAYYGLAVALERQGDLPAALAAARVANAVHLPIGLYSTADPLDLPQVFFVPAYEMHYYRALAALADASEESDPDDRSAALRDSLDAWNAYLEAAEPDHAHWVPNARRLRAKVERELARQER